MDIEDDNLDAKSNMDLYRFELHDCSSSSSSSLSSSHLLTSKNEKDDEIFDSTDEIMMECNNKRNRNDNEGNRCAVLDSNKDERNCHSTKFNECKNQMKPCLTLKSFFHPGESIGINPATVVSPRFNERARNWFKKRNKSPKKSSLPDEQNASSTTLAKSLRTKSMKQSKIRFSKSDTNSDHKIKYASITNSNTSTNNETKNICAFQNNNNIRDNVRHANPPVLSRSTETIDLVESDSDTIHDNDSESDSDWIHRNESFDDEFLISSRDAPPKCEKNNENHDDENNCDIYEVESDDLLNQDGLLKDSLSEEKKYEVVNIDDEEEINICSNASLKRREPRRSKRLSKVSIDHSKRAEFVQLGSDVWMKSSSDLNTATQSISMLARRSLTTRNDLSGGSGVGVGGVLVLGSHDPKIQNVSYESDSENIIDLPKASTTNKKKRDNVKSTKAKGRSNRWYKRKKSSWGQKRRGQNKNKKYSRSKGGNAWSSREQGFGSYNNARSTSSSGSYMEISRQDPQLGNNGGANITF